jgi:arylsulfatase A-like enzyme
MPTGERKVEAMKRPNILYIHSHDTGRYVQPYGYAVATPHIQQLAEEGILFRQAYSASPTCSPSRATLLTGQYPHSNGMLGLAHRGFSLYDYGHHVLHTLRKEGYISALAGVQHIADAFDPPWKKIGYDLKLGSETDGEAGPHIPSNNAHLAAAEFLDRAPQQPFFLSVGLVETHRDFPPLRSGAKPGYVGTPPPMPDFPEIREDTARLKLSVQDLDAKMGAVFEALRRNGLMENTLVLCTTDHGIPFPWNKCTLTGNGLGVMLILRGPGGFSGGRVIDSLVSQVDVFPTMCDWLDIPAPDWLQGRSFMPLIRGEAIETREQVFGEVNYHAAYEPMRSVRTKRWSYIRRFDPRPHPVLPNTDNSPGKQILIEHGWESMPQEEEYLFDLVFDPYEVNNLAGEAGKATVLAEMRARLGEWMEGTGDPLLGGPIPLPANAWTDSPEAKSAT